MLKNVGKIADPFIPDNLFPIPADFEALDLGEFIDQNFRRILEVSGTN